MDNNRTEEEQLYDILNLSPLQVKMDTSSLGASLMKDDYDQMYRQLGAADTSGNGSGDGSGGGIGAGDEGDNNFQKNANLNLSSNTGLSLNTANLQQLNDQLLSPGSVNTNHLHPYSPGVYTPNSVYTDNLLNPGSPFMDAASHFSQNAYSDIQQPQVFVQGSNYLDSNVMSQGNTFDTEIALGESISSTNLIGMVDASLPQQPQQPQEFNYTVTQSYGIPTDNVSSGGRNDYRNQLTENNLINYNNFLQHEQKEVTISVQQAPEDVAARTPSLFSASSHNSSLSNSPVRLLSNTNLYNGKLVQNNQICPTSPYSNPYELPEQNTLLNPDEYQSIKRGRKKSHSNKVRSRLTSRNRSRSTEDDSDLDEDANSDTVRQGNSISSREKMLELASPNQSSRRTQKHPSVYACHLCEKRFTRPYNLKSHLRTHTDERPFICNVCGKAFARQHDRKRHEDLHTGEKKFQCKGFLKDGTPYGCGRKFARADALRRHFQTEAGKECIRLLVEEDEKDRENGTQRIDQDENSVPFQGVGSEYLSPTGGFANSSTNSLQSVPQVAISPPD